MRAKVTTLLLMVMLDNKVATLTVMLAWPLTGLRPRVRG